MNILNATSIVENNEVEFPKNDGLKQLKDSHYSVIAAYDSLVLDKNDMKKIYSELKKVKANINRTNMDTIKYWYIYTYINIILIFIINIIF